MTSVTAVPASATARRAQWRESQGPQGRPAIEGAKNTTEATEKANEATETAERTGEEPNAEDAEVSRRCAEEEVSPRSHQDTKEQKGSFDLPPPHISAPFSRIWLANKKAMLE